MAIKYSIGVDYGTELGRAVLVDVADGREVATAVHPYSNGVIDERLPGSKTPLPPDWALQDPNDYIEVLKNAIPTVLKESGINPKDVIGIGVDFTSCTILPTKKDGTPLCNLPEWRNTPHAWVKLWKHHAAQDEANRLNEIATKQGFSFLDRYGGKVSSEWFIPKIWQVLNEAPEVYAAAERFIEAGDWIIWQMTGVETRNSCAAGYKGIWSKREGYPPDAFFKALDPRMEHVIDERLSRQISPIGSKAGELTPQMASLTGLLAGTPVAVAIIDAHSAVPAATVVEPGRMVAIMGTSTCHMVLGEKEHIVPGMCGYVEDGIIPGLFGYEAGQSCVGDHFAWFIENCLPASYEHEAQNQGISVHTLLEEKARQIKPGQSGLLALDWWNGNRSVLVDVDLTGLIIGLTLATKPEEIYRALIEATAFGSRVIVETYQQNGVPIHEFVATGGLPDKNKLLMQIYADVLKMPVRIAEAKQATALGAAMFGAVVAGKGAGGYDSMYEASQKMTRLREESYTPIAENSHVYDSLYAEYMLLHDTFGRGGNNVMKRLKNLRKEILGVA